MCEIAWLLCLESTGAKARVLTKNNRYDILIESTETSITLVNVKLSQSR